VLYVSYTILLFKNILGTYVVMSSIFKTGQWVKLPMVVDFTYWAPFGFPLGSSVLFFVLGDNQVALRGQNGGGRI
jgi:Na+-driven multidrug efflux pump